MADTQKRKSRKDQTFNRSGGAVFEIDKWSKLDRFLILGTESSTYKCGKGGEFTFPSVMECVKEDGIRVVDRIVGMSKSGRTFRNDYAIFALAYAMKKGDLKTRKAAGAAVRAVCRTGTHLFQLCNAIDRFGGWGKIVHRSLQNWYNKKTPKNLGYQLMKYQSREGWSHRDVLRKVRPRPPRDVYDALYRWAVKSEIRNDVTDEALDRIKAFEECKSVPKNEPDRAINLIHEYDLPRECVPTWLRSDPRVQMALLHRMPMTAMIRNLGSLTASGCLDKYPKAIELVCERLADSDRLRSARVHPMRILNALKVYKSGRGHKGSLRWDPVEVIINGLDAAFYKSFEAVEPTNKRICIALDVSSSMRSRASGLTLTCQEASAGLALTSVATEPRTEVVGFTCAGSSSGGRRGGWASAGNVKPLWEDSKFGIGGLDIQPSRRMDDVIKYIDNLGFGGTDCAAPMLWAMSEGRLFDLFVIFTDNETWAGNVHPYQALTDYRKKSDIPARLVVVSMTGTHFSIADPKDPGMLDVVGCDTSTPRLISEFAKGRI